MPTMRTRETAIYHFSRAVDLHGSPQVMSVLLDDTGKGTDMLIVSSTPESAVEPVDTVLELLAKMADAKGKVTGQRNVVLATTRPTTQPYQPNDYDTLQHLRHVAASLDLVLIDWIIFSGDGTARSVNITLEQLDGDEDRWQRLAPAGGGL